MTNDYSQKNSGQITRRAFLKYSAGTVGAVGLSSLLYGCGGGGETRVQQFPIDSNVSTTLERMISFPKSILPGLAKTELDQIPKYKDHGYGNWTFGSGLPVVKRADLMRVGYIDDLPKHQTKFLNFFAFTDIHITDKEAPNQLMHFQKIEPDAYGNTSIYSGVMMYTTHVLDAAIQTVNALHKKNPFDFGISLGDTCNSTSYNELRWYIDVIDGKVITPSSGAHIGADSIDFQKPFKAAGLDKTIPWYQVMGNHDHFMIGSFTVDADPALGFRQSYIADSVWSIGNPLHFNRPKFPVLFNMDEFKGTPSYYPGVMDGSSPYGQVIHSGVSTLPQFAAGAPKVAADPDRRSLLRSEWVQEFYNTTTSPVGHGLNLVDKTIPAVDGFACYSFVPNSKLPLKIIVLDDTQSEHDESKDIHGHGYLDAKRWAWLQAELDQGQKDNQLMVIAAHIPIGVSAVGEELDWWQGESDTPSAYKNAANLTDLVAKLQSTPNLLMWIAGHRHLNVVKAFPSSDLSKPEQGFWQVETSSLRDFPQQLRTFEIYLNSDYTVSIVTINVDPAIAEGTPAATSRKYAVAAQQIIQSDLQHNNPNLASIPGYGDLPTIDPTRPQSNDVTQIDPSIQFVDLSNAAQPVPYNASYNAELFKQLSPKMVAFLQEKFLQPTSQST